jgi:hypothetical protein
VRRGGLPNPSVQFQWWRRWWWRRNVIS